MVLDRYEPYREMAALRDMVSGLFSDASPRGAFFNTGNSVSALPLDVSETSDDFVVEANLPGVNPDDVQITVHGDTLTIRAQVHSEDEKSGKNWLVRERRGGVFQRSLTLHAPVDSNRAAASFDHGVLTLKLPKAEEAKPKTIKLQPKA